MKLIIKQYAHKSYVNKVTRVQTLSKFETMAQKHVDKLVLIFFLFHGFLNTVGWILHKKKSFFIVKPSYIPTCRK